MDTRPKYMSYFKTLLSHSLNISLILKLSPSHNHYKPNRLIYGYVNVTFVHKVKLTKVGWNHDRVCIIMNKTQELEGPKYVLYANLITKY